jgi:hypothetical protein
LQEGVDFRHGDEPAEVGDVFRFSLEEEEKVSIFLGLVIVGKVTFLKIKGIFEVAGDLILLPDC